MSVMKQKYRRRFPILALLAASLASGLVLSSCKTVANTIQAAGGAEQVTVPGGDPLEGREAIVLYGCDTCHTIPGIPGADATVGPPLNNWANRQYIAGALDNTPDNLLLWIMDPQDVEPGTAMPDMGVTEEAARHISAYLYTLRRAGSGR